MIKETIYKCIHSIFPKKSIIFESAPDYSDNTKAVFDEMVRRGLNEKYYLVWHTFDYGRTYFIEGKNIKHITGWNLKARYFYAIAKAFISCNRYLTPVVSGQKCFYLTHGTPIKETHDYYHIPSYIDYCFAASRKTISLESYSFNFPENKIFALGYPRNDIMTCSKKINMSGLLGDYDKYIVWYPTFRQHKCKAKFSTSDDALPIIHDGDFAIKLNELAKEENILIVLKPHFAQDISYITDLDLSNVRFIDDTFFLKNGISSYEFVSSCDAMLTDYSSIYYDFLLCNKPIGLIWEDIEDYKKMPGLVQDYKRYCSGGEKIYNIQDLCQFVYNVSKNIDTLKEQRNIITKEMNYSDDGKNSERVANFIINQARL